jgi:hypothetical protein
MLATKVPRHFFVNPEDKSIFENRKCFDNNFPDGNSDTSVLFNM